MHVDRTTPILPAHPGESEGRRHLNRELSWLSFDERVLEIAAAPTTPLLERAKFLAIAASNLDEFFQVRVAGLKEQVAMGIAPTPPDGMTPKQQLAAIGEHVRIMTDRMSTLFHDVLVPALEAEGIRFCDVGKLDDDDRAHLDTVFEQRVYPVLTPLAVDPAHPFPYISNLSLNLAVVVRDPITHETRFARVKVPPILPRFVVLPDGERFVPLEQVIAGHLDRLFPGLEIVEHHAFRVTRNADMVVEEEEADDLLQAIETELIRRRFGRVVRLEVEPDMPDATLGLLTRELDIHPDDVHVSAGPLDLAGLSSLLQLDRPDLLFEPFTPTTQPRLTAQAGEELDLFGVVRNSDVLVHHPYDSFATSVTAFIEEAARDPDVLAIKITLYRTSGPGSPIVRALMEAAREGKQVVALVELKARFDEERNIEWARALEEAGVHVAYGVVGLKTHTKVALVVRSEQGRIQRYAHLGTGNYNDKTARIYEDVGVLTADPDVGADLSDLFNVLTGYSRQSSYRTLLVAPTSLRDRLTELIRREAEADDGHIVVKCNNVVDEDIIEELYAASAAGTRVELVVRGICTLRPGVPGLSENITVRSLVGRYLEHSRILRFGSRARGHDYLIGSADLMPRNLNRRVEAVLPVTDPRLQGRLQEILDVLLADTELAWVLCPDGAWEKVPPTGELDAQARLQDLALDRTRPRRVGTTEEVLDVPSLVTAAGGVVLRRGEEDTEVLVVHRPRYDDWSLPKGKLDPGESWEQAARREVLEETGVTVELGPELSAVHYTDRRGQPKTVRWWMMTPVAGAPRHREADAEIDAARWVTIARARTLLSYETDRRLLREALDRAGGEVDG
ncbi:MAG: polyphosphate kinase 1 [Actinomycetes bacterium]